MVFVSKFNEYWTARGTGCVAVGGANDHNVCPSRANQDEEEEPTARTMEIFPYNFLEDKGPCFPSLRG